MERSLVRSGSSRIARFSLVFAAFAGLVAADTVLELYSDTLTTYKAGQSGVQKVKPLPEQRAVNLDGSLRRGSTHAIALAGNPYENAWKGTSEIGGIRLDSGTWQPTDVDLAFPAQAAWVVGRSYNARQTDSGSQYDSDGPMGRNWAATSMPEIVSYVDSSDHSKDTIYLVAGADRYTEYQRKSSTSNEYKGKNGAAGIILYASGSPDTYKLLDQNGNETWFFGFNTSKTGAYGQLWRIVDPEGKTAYVGDASSASTAVTSGFDSNGRLQYAYDSANHRFTYTFNGDTPPHISQVKAELPDGSWPTPSGTEEVGRVDYTYYGNESHGDPGDLKTVTTTLPLSDYGVTDVRVRYYRYWENSFDSSTNPGYPHAVKLWLDAEGTRQFDWGETGTGEPEFDSGFLSASDSALTPYAAAYFEYDSSHRVKLAFFNGQCGCSGAGNGQFNFRYETSGTTFTSSYDNFWARRTCVERPDHTWLTQYFDEAGQSLHRVITSGDPAGSPASTWVERVDRDSSGFVTDVAMPDNLASYSYSAGTFSGSTSDGLVWHYDRASSGANTGYVTAVKFKKGTSGSAMCDRSIAWNTPSEVITGGTGTVVRPMPNEDMRYAVESTSPSSSDQRYTDFANTLSSGTIAMEARAATLQAVDATYKNGSGDPDISRVHYTLGGLTDYQNDEGGHITYREYTNTQVTKLIRDADTSLNGSGQDFYGLTIPSNFSKTGTPLHERTKYAYDDQGRLSVTTLFAGDSNHERKTLVYYTHLKDRRLVTLEFPKYTTSSYKVYGPVRYRVTNQAGKVEVEGTIALTSNESTTALSGFIDETVADPITAVGVGSVAQMRTSIFDPSGTQVSEERAYFAIPSSLPGTDGTHYDPTKYGYDDFGRRVRVKDATGTITRTVYDARGMVIERWIGTNDYSFAGGETSGTDNMVKVEELAHDGGSSGKNGYLTKRTLFIDDTTTGKRETTYANDLRGRVIAIINPTAPHTVNALDNLGRVTMSAQYSSSSGLDATSVPTTTTNRLALSDTMYDERGHVYKTVRHKIDAGDGSDDDSLEALTWYDGQGRVVKRDGEQLEKFFYDRLSRQTNHFVLASVNDTTYAHALDVAGDLVLEEQQTVYDTDDAVILQATIARLHDDYSNGTTGPLDVNADGGSAGTGDPKLLTAADIKGRIQISAMWYDAFERLADRVEYGTNSSTSSVATFDRNSLAVPARSDNALRTSYEYNTDGTLKQTTDPRGLVAHTDYDALGRRTKSIGNYIESHTPATALPGDPNPDSNQTVVYAYTDGLQTSITADLPSGETDQVTTYTFGTTKGTSAGDSAIATGDRLHIATYPDSTGSSDVVTFAYNAQGQEIWKKDQAGGVIESVYDDSGRQTHRRVSTLASGFDGAVRRISTTYDSIGRTQLVTQYDNATVGSGSVVDEVKYVYDGWGNLTDFKQDRDSAVGSSGFWAVSYAYAKATGGRNTLRRTSETLPNGDVFNYTYSSSGNLLDADASRVTQIQDGSSTTLVTYDYNGAGQVVGTYLAEPSVSSNVHGTTSGSYPDLDRFNRVTTSKWTKKLAYPATDKDFYHVALAYDRNSNITSQDDSVHTGFDVVYTNDDLNRLTRAQEGTMASGSITTAFRDEQWTLNQTGNWNRDKVDLNGDGDFTDTDELDDSRTHNDVNELTARDIHSDSSVVYSTLGYDPVGNLTDDKQSYQFEWDAFGRLRRVNNRSTGNLVSEYWYNGLGYLLSRLQDTNRDGSTNASTGDKKFHSVYDERWRVVATYRTTDTSPKEQFLYHAAGAGGYGGSSYIDSVVRRDKDASTSWTSAANALDERAYYCQNWRADVVAIVGVAGDMWEWDKYSAYGVPVGMPGGDFNSDGKCDSADITLLDTCIASGPYDVRGDIDLDGTVNSTDKATVLGGYDGLTAGRGVLSLVDSRKGYAGYEFDAKIGNKWHVRHRVLASELGKWLTRDPFGYVDGFGLAAYCGSAPVSRIDASGFCALKGLGYGDPGQSGGGGGVCNPEGTCSPTSGTDTKGTSTEPKCPGVYAGPGPISLTGFRLEQQGSGNRWVAFDSPQPGDCATGCHYPNFEFRLKFAEYHPGTGWSQHIGPESYDYWHSSGGLTWQVPPGFRIKNGGGDGTNNSNPGWIVDDAAVPCDNSNTENCKNFSFTAKAPGGNDCEVTFTIKLCCTACQAE